MRFWPLGFQTDLCFLSSLNCTVIGIKDVLDQQNPVAVCRLIPGKPVSQRSQKAIHKTPIRLSCKGGLFECKSVRSKVVSIEGRFDRQKSIRSKTRVSSIEDCNYCLSVLHLSNLQVSENGINDLTPHNEKTTFYFKHKVQVLTFGNNNLK